MEAVLEAADPTTPETRAWFRTGGLLVGLSGIASLAGFIASMVTERFLGAPEFAAISAALGLVSGATLPSGLLLLPVAGWAAKRADWRRRLPVFQAVGALLGGASVLLAVTLIRYSALPSWVPLLTVLGGAAYLTAISSGVLLGRQAFVLLNAIATVPNLLRVVGLAALLVLGLLRVPALVIAAYSVASTVSCLLTTAACYSLPAAARIHTPRKGGTWASGWVALMATLWTGLDVTIAYHVLHPTQAGEYAVLTLIAKTPFFIGSVLANMSIGEAAWGKATMRRALIAIALVGLLGVAGTLLLGGRLLTIAKVAPEMSDLLLMIVGNTALCMVYLVSGVEAHQGHHAWWIGIAGFAVWTACAFSPWVSVNLLAWAECILNIAAGGYLYERTRRSPTLA